MLSTDFARDVAFWGDGLFENNNDLSMVAQFDRSAGIVELQTALNAARENGPPLRYSLYAGQCSSQEAVAAVRNHLTTTGKLGELAGRQASNFFNPIDADTDYTCQGYTCFILAACYLSLGINLKDVALPRNSKKCKNFLDFTKATYASVAHRDAAKESMQRALAKPPGTKINFNSTSLQQYRQARINRGMTAEPPHYDLLGAIPLPVEENRGSFGMAPKVFPGGIVALAGTTWCNMLSPEKKERVYGADAKGCGFCGSTESAMLNCTRCKDQVYCNAECQKGDWKRHKRVCRTPESRAKMFGPDHGIWMTTWNLTKESVG